MYVVQLNKKKKKKEARKVWALAFVLLQWGPPMRGVPPGMPL